MAERLRCPKVPILYWPLLQARATHLCQPDAITRWHRSTVKPLVSHMQSITCSQSHKVDLWVTGVAFSWGLPVDGSPDRDSGQVLSHFVYFLTRRACCTCSSDCYAWSPIMAHYAQSSLCIHYCYYSQYFHCDVFLPVLAMCSLVPGVHSVQFFTYANSNRETINSIDAENHENVTQFPHFPLFEIGTTF